MRKCMQRDDLNTFFRFMGLMGDRLPVYLGAILLSTIGDAGRKIANSYLIQSIVTAAQDKNVDNVLLPVLGNFAVFVVCLLLWRFGIIRYNIEGRTGAGKVEKLVFSKAMRLPMSYYEQNHSSDFMSRLIFDTQKASDIYIEASQAACRSAFDSGVPDSHVLFQLGAHTLHGRNQPACFRGRQLVCETFEESGSSSFRQKQGNA